MKELIEELKLNRVAYLLEIMEKKDFDSKINANVNNIEIIKNLNTSGNLKNIYLLNNKIDDYTELNKLSFNIKEW